ncbi:MAG: hypothetical protein WD898_03760 [Candidatus Paceibacterota bacterium]
MMRILKRPKKAGTAESEAASRNRNGDGTKAFKLKMPRSPTADKQAPLVLILLSDRDGLTEQDPKVNAETLFKCLAVTVAHEELVELKKLLPEH